VENAYLDLTLIGKNIAVAAGALECGSR